MGRPPNSLNVVEVGHVQSHCAMLGMPVVLVPILGRAPPCCLEAICRTQRSPFSKCARAIERAESAGQETILCATARCDSFLIRASSTRIHRSKHRGSILSQYNTFSAQPWNGRSNLVASACPPAAYPVPSRLSSMNGFLSTLTPQCAHDLSGRQRVSTQVPLWKRSKQQGDVNEVNGGKAATVWTHQTTSPQGRTTKALTLLVNVLRQTGQMAAESPDWALSLSSTVNLTTVRLLRLMGCAGLATWHRVCSLTSRTFAGVAVGVREGCERVIGLATRVRRRSSDSTHEPEVGKLRLAPGERETQC